MDCGRSQQTLDVLMVEKPTNQIKTFLKHFFLTCGVCWDDPKTGFCQRSRPADVLHQLQNSNSQLHLGGDEYRSF